MPSAPSVLPRILPVLTFTLICYIVIGMQMPVVPLFVHLDLGYGTALAGFAVSAQYLATLATRTWAGHQLDTRGARDVVVTGLLVGALSGAALAASSLCPAWPCLSLGLLLLGRALLGFSESWVAVGVIIWNLHRAGHANASTVISWNGICSYGGIALGAPVASLIYGSHTPPGDLLGVGLLAALLFLLCVPHGLRQETTRPEPPLGPRPSFLTIFRAILPYGCALGAASVGFGAIVSCLTLYFEAGHWPGAAIALALFGSFFVVTRFIFARTIDRIGGRYVSLISMIVETFGLLVLAWGDTPGLADLGAALTGIGFSLVFPALGVLMLEKVGTSNRGVAVGAFSVFLDLAIAFSGPALGMIIPIWGFPVLFAAAAICALSGGVLTFCLPSAVKAEVR